MYYNVNLWLLNIQFSLLVLILFEKCVILFSMSYKQKNILIIDDKKDILDAFKNVLEDEGYSVSTAENHIEADKCLKEKHIDLVFLDVWLPGVDGLNILSNIKKEYLDTEVIMMSGHAGLETAIRATKMGAYDFLEKPITTEKLISFCKNIVKEKSFQNTDVLKSEEDKENDIKKEVSSHIKTGQKKTFTVKQKTISKSIVITGFALMEGRKTALTLLPAPANTGIVFIDIITDTHIKLAPENILSKDGSGYVNSTVLVNGERHIKTTEHLLAALNMYGISNLYVKCDSEVPNVDGSALVFCNAIEEAGITEQEENAEVLVIDKEFIYGKVDEKESYMIVSPYDGFKVTLRIDFPNPIGVQTHTFIFEDTNSFKEEIGKARSFNSIDNIDYAQKNGMAGSGLIGSHIIFCDGKIINGKLHFENELVRHKILDIIGDMYILGRGIRCRIKANKTSHSFNHSVIKDLAKYYYI